MQFLSVDFYKNLDLSFTIDSSQKKSKGVRRRRRRPRRRPRQSRPKSARLSARISGARGARGLHRRCRSRRRRSRWTLWSTPEGRPRIEAIPFDETLCKVTLKEGALDAASLTNLANLGTDVGSLPRRDHHLPPVTF